MLCYIQINKQPWPATPPLPPLPLHSYNQNEFQNDFQHDSLIIFSSINLNVPKSQGLKSQVPMSQSPKVQWSQGPKLPSYKAHKPFYSSQNPLNSGLTLKQLLLV